MRYLEAYDTVKLYSQLLNRISSSTIVEYGPDGPCPWESDWREWLRHLFPSQTAGGFAPRHENFWAWLWGIQRGDVARAFVAVWPRGGAKSTSGELGCVALGARGKRGYVLYVSGTQELADKHVQDIATKLESPEVDRWYPALGRRHLSKYGTSCGWRGNRLYTDSGFVVDSIGLDANIRGTKVDDRRPDLIVLDDVDHLLDSPNDTQKKIDTITHSILPSGSIDCIVLVLQNLIHRDSIISRLAGVSEYSADFLHDRIVDGPHKAIDGLVVDDRDGKPTIIGGVATWNGQPIEACQTAISTYGLNAFLQESQQEIDRVDGPMYGHVTFRRCNPDEIPPLDEIVVSVDPAVTSSDQSDACGIQADGRAEDGDVYRLWSWERRASPDYALRLALAKAVELGATTVLVETNQGGELWEKSYRVLLKDLENGTLEVDGKTVRLREGDPPQPSKPAIPGIRPAVPSKPGTPGQQAPGFASAHPSGAGESKTERQARQVVAYEQGRIIHVLGPTTDVLEKALKRFDGKRKPMDLADASYHGWHFLAGSRREIKWA